MMENNNTENAVQKQEEKKIEDKQEQSIESKADEILKEANLLEAGKILDDRKKKLEEMEERVNKKLKTIENSIRLSEQGGRSFAGNAVVKEKSPEELKKEKTMEFFKGTEVEQALKKHG